MHQVSHANANVVATAYAEVFLVLNFCVITIVNIRKVNFQGIALPAWTTTKVKMPSAWICTVLKQTKIVCLYTMCICADGISILYDLSCARSPKIFWPLLREKYYNMRETSNLHNPFAVAILKDGVMVSHVPLQFAHYSWGDTELFRILKGFASGWLALRYPAG